MGLGICCLGVVVWWCCRVVGCVGFGVGGGSVCFLVGCGIGW